MYSKEIKITLPLPPSVNGLYAGMQRRFKSGKYKDWIKLAAESWDCKEAVNPDAWLKVRYNFHMPLWYKNGNVKKRDVANYEKAVSDFLGDHLSGFEDKMILDIRLVKIDSERDEVDIIINEAE